MEKSTRASSETTMTDNQDVEKTAAVQPRLSPVVSRAEAHPSRADLEDDQSKEDKARMAANDPSAFPDGGIGIFQDYYSRNQLKQYSSSKIAWIPSLETFMMFFLGPLFGKVVDDNGPRVLLIGGTFLHIFGIMMTSICKEYYQFILAQGICSPIGASALFYAAMTSVGTWFFKNRALAYGVMASGSSLGGVIMPIMIDRLIPQIGFGWAMRATAFLMLGLLIFANLTVKSRLPPSPKPLVLKEFVTPLTEVPFLTVLIACMLFFFGMFLPFTFVIIQAQREGMSISLSAYLVPILNAASIFGRIIPGAMGDRFGRFNMMIVMSYFSAIIVLALWLPSRSNAPIIIFAALYGFGTGAFISLAPALIAQISDVRKIGVRNGALFAFISWAALVGSPIGGALITHDHGNFSQLQIFCGVLMMAGSTFFVVSRVYQEGWKVMHKI
ncbi:MAG: hypothetical protein M1814_001368 [Vezdaea aestivalis]|nr:MAG: hypothetical protein M1814_001368 [Vezdaea aestivalis]